MHLIQSESWDGVNIDFETNQGTADDAQKFASFLRKLADAVHAVGGRVSVDTNWGAYLNPGTLVKGNRVDTFCDMQTCKATIACPPTPIACFSTRCGGAGLCVDGLHDTDFKGDLVRDSNLTTMARYGLGVCPTCCNPCVDVELKPAREVKWNTREAHPYYKEPCAHGSD